MTDGDPCGGAAFDFDAGGSRRVAFGAGGRGQLAASLVELLAAATPAAVQLVGPRWIGKTWLLRFLASGAGQALLAARAAYGPDEAGQRRGIALYACLEGPGGGAELDRVTDELYVRLAADPRVDLQPWAPEVALGIPTAALTQEERVRRLLTLARAAHAAGLRILLYLDHLDRAGPAERRALIPALKEWSDWASVLLALRRPLVDIVPGIADSPLAHKLVHREIGLLRADEAARLLAQPPDGAPWRQGARPFTPEEQEALIGLVGPHPYLLLRAAEAACQAVAAGAVLTAGEVWLSVAPSLETIFAHLHAEHRDDLVAFWPLVQDPATDWEAAARTPAVRRLRGDAIIHRGPAGGRFEFTCKLFEGYLAERPDADAASAQTPQGGEPPAPAPPAAGEDWLAGLAAETGSNERRFLELLAAQPGRLVADEQIAAHLWPGRPASTVKHRLHTTADRARRKLAGAADGIKIVRRWGHGYAIERPAE